MSAADLLKNAKACASLEKAVSETHFVVGTTRRTGRKRGAFLPFETAIRKIAETAEDKKVAVVFGKESKGLSNPHLAACDWVMTIPVHPDYPSFNLAQAVMIVAFSLFVYNRPGLQDAHLSIPSLRESAQMIRSNRTIVSKDDVEEVLTRFERALMKLDYKPAVIFRILRSLKSLFKRSGLIQSEVQMFKGLTRRIIEGPPRLRHWRSNSKQES